ncbi:MAG: hypothetical protein KGN84_16530 [Acidobacteriota bacterium]|nr:hypothetical protein [Acidobacteriota bacterium]
MRFLAACLLIFAGTRASAADLVFQGKITRLGSRSLTVKLEDRTEIDALLPSRKPRIRFQMGDEVEIACKPVREKWEEETSRFQLLGVTRMRLIRGGSAPPAETFRTVLSDSPAIEHAREVNLEYAKHLPNFVADETVKRSFDRRGTGDWKFEDTIESEISFSGWRAARRNVLRNGKAWRRPIQALPGFVWYGGFGTEIEPLFDRGCPTILRDAGKEESALVFGFESPADGCFGRFTVGYERFNPARSGRVFVSESDGHMLRYEEDATGFPEHFEFEERKESVRWDYVKIGDGTHLLPVHAEFLVTYRSGVRWRLVVDYTNHRHFESASRVDYQ